MATLHYKLLGDNNRPALVILHGLFGMLDNWQTIGHKLSDDYAVWLIDQRNHGKSLHSLTFDYHTLSDDLYDFFQQHKLTHVAGLIGHSMGGKVAMRFAVEHGDRIDKLIVADIAPKSYPLQGHDRIFRALFDLDVGRFGTRAEAETAFAAQISDAATYQFLLKNLSRKSEGGYAWKFNFEAIYYNYADIVGNPLHQFDRYDGQTLFLKGANSPDYIALPTDEAAIKHYFPQARIAIVENAGHWIHAEQPEAFIEAVRLFLRN